MNWFRQNRALGTLLIVFGSCAVFAGILLYWRWAGWSDARQAFDQAATERSRLEHLDPFPNDTNYRKLQGYLDRYNAAMDADRVGDERSGHAASFSDVLQVPYDTA